MSKQHLTGVGLLLITALIWGLGFVAQRESMQHIEPFSFNAARFILGTLSVIPVVMLFSKPAHAHGPNIELYGGGILLGLFLFAGINLQQAGMVYTSAGKAAFITGLYIVLVPMIGFFFGRKIGKKVWFAAIVATIGLYLLSVDSGFALGRGDGLVLVSSIFWALQVYLTGRLAANVDGPKLAFVQFATCAVASLACALWFETPNFDAVWNARWAILYTGILATGVAITFQIMAQKSVPSSQAALIMSLETVFGAIGGWYLLGEQFSDRAMLGAGLMLGAIIVAQLPGVRRRKPIRMWFKG